MHSNKSTELDWLEAIFTHPWRKWKAFNELSITEKKQKEKNRKEKKLSCRYVTHTQWATKPFALQYLRWPWKTSSAMNEWMNERKKNNSTNNTNWTNAVYECNLRLTGSLDGTYTQNLYANDTVWPQIENDTFLFRMMAATLFRTKPSPGYHRVSKSGLHFVIKIFDRCCLCK